MEVASHQGSQGVQGTSRGESPTHHTDGRVDEPIVIALVGTPVSGLATDDASCWSPTGSSSSTDTWELLEGQESAWWRGNPQAESAGEIQHLVVTLLPPSLERQVTMNGWHGFWGLNGWAGSATGTDDHVFVRSWHIMGDDVSRWRRLTHPRQLAGVPSGLYAEARYREIDGHIEVTWQLERPVLISQERAEYFSMSALLEEGVNPRSGLRELLGSVDRRWLRSRRVRRLRTRVGVLARLNGNNGSYTNTDDHRKQQLRFVLRFLRNLGDATIESAFAVITICSLQIIADNLTRKNKWFVCSVIAPLTEEIVPDVMTKSRARAGAVRFMLMLMEYFAGKQGTWKERLREYWTTASMHMTCFGMSSAPLAVLCHSAYNMWALEHEKETGTLANLVDESLRELERVRPAVVHVRELEGRLTPAEAHAQQAQVRAAWRRGQSGPTSTQSEGGSRGGRGGRRRRKKKGRGSGVRPLGDASSAPTSPAPTSEPTAGFCEEESGGGGSGGGSEADTTNAPSEAQEHCEDVVLRYYLRRGAVGVLSASATGARMCDRSEGDGALALELGYTCYTLHRVPKKVYEAYRLRVAAFKLTDSTIRALHGALQQLDEYQKLDLLRQEYVKSVLPAIVEQRIALQTLADSRVGGNRGIPEGSLNSGPPVRGTWGGFACTMSRNLLHQITATINFSLDSIVQDRLPCAPDGSLLVTTGDLREPAHRGIALSLGLCALTVGLSMLATRRTSVLRRIGSSTTRLASWISIRSREIAQSARQCFDGLLAWQGVLGALPHIIPSHGLSGVRRPSSNLIPNAR